MKSLSAHYTPALAILGLLALALIAYTRWLPNRDECPSSEALLDAESLDPRIVLITEGMRGTDIAKERLTGTIAATRPQASPLVMTITRSFGLPTRLLQPADALPGRREPDEVESAWLDTGDRKIAVRYAYEKRGDSVRATAYFMTYRGRSIESPLWTLLRDAPSTLWTGRWPITLFAASNQAHVSRVEDAKQSLDEWMRTAWNHYQRICGGGPSQPGRS